MGGETTQRVNLSKGKGGVSLMKLLKGLMGTRKQDLEVAILKKGASAY